MDSASSLSSIHRNLGVPTRRRDPSLIPNIDDHAVEIVKQGWLNKQGGAKGGRKSWSGNAQENTTKHTRHFTHTSLTSVHLCSSMMMCRKRRWFVLKEDCLYYKESPEVTDTIHIDSTVE